MSVTKPTPQKTFLIYEALVLLFMGQKIERENLHFKLVEILEHPNLHSESIVLMSLFKLLFSLLSKIGIHDLTLIDITHPRRKSITRILSALINFAKFREEHLMVFDECTLKTDQAIEQARILEDRNLQLAEKVNTLALKREEQKPAVEKLQKLNSALATDLIELQKIQKNLTTEVENLRNTKVDLEAKLTNINLSFTSAKQECERIRSRIVANPEKLEHAIKDMNSNVISTKQFVTDLELKSRKLGKKLEMLSVIEHEIFGCVKIMEECQEDVKEFKILKIKNVKCKEDIEIYKQEKKDIGIKQQQGQRQLTGCNDRIQRLMFHQTQKQDSLDKSIELLMSNYLVSLEEEKKVQLELEKDQCYVDELERLIIEREKECENQENDLCQKIILLNEHLESYQNYISSGFKFHKLSNSSNIA
ncbi:kinetochore-associated Ndc80 complex subunit nuf2 [Lobulomyces angularis]|nr:kinetochore-associated Ndc80 complex subunit nuf2 [Lobulomyces angularis]